MAMSKKKKTAVAVIAFLGFLGFLKLITRTTGEPPVVIDETVTVERVVRTDRDIIKITYFDLLFGGFTTQQPFENAARNLIGSLLRKGQMNQTQFENITMQLDSLGVT